MLLESEKATAQIQFKKLIKDDNYNSLTEIMYINSPTEETIISNLQYSFTFLENKPSPLDNHKCSPALFDKTKIKEKQMRKKDQNKML